VENAHYAACHLISFLLVINGISLTLIVIIAMWYYTADGLQNVCRACSTPACKNPVLCLEDH